MKEENSKVIELVQKIRQARKYKHLSEELIKSEVESYIKKYPKYQEYKEKLILKEIKAKLHKIHGSFQIKDTSKRMKLLEELKNNPKNLLFIEKILETNSSTKERLDIYPELYEKIFELTGKPKSILDLGCGLNPVSFPYMNIRNNITYYAYDISKSDAEFLSKFFEMMKISYETEPVNLSNMENIKLLPKADICFMFKLLDVLEKSGHKYSEEIIKVLAEKCKYLIVSFATKTVTGKPMNYPYRGWIERMLTRIDLNYKILEFESEFFYVIRKNEDENT